MIKILSEQHMLSETVIHSLTLDTKALLRDKRNTILHDEEVLIDGAFVRILRITKPYSGQVEIEWDIVMVNGETIFCRAKKYGASL